MVEIYRQEYVMHTALVLASRQQGLLWRVSGLPLIPHRTVPYLTLRDTIPITLVRGTVWQQSRFYLHIPRRTKPNLPPPHNALGASNICLVGANPTCSVSAL